MTDNKDIAVLAKKVYELSVLPVAELDARKWEALLILNAVYSSATPEGVAAANADKETRWHTQIAAEGLLAALHPKWHLRTDDGKPPAARFALASALDNPHRDLRTRLATLLLVAPADRPPLTDLARALLTDAWDGATGDARVQFSQTMRGISTTWTKDPWLTVLMHDGSSPLSILIEHQGITNDGGIFDDDPMDDTLAANWNRAIHNWDIDFLRDNSFAQLFTAMPGTVSSVAEAAGNVAKGALEATKGIAKLLTWTPYILGGIGILGATTFIVLASNQRSNPIPPMPTRAPAEAP